MKKLIIIILIILLNTGCYDNVDLNYLYIITGIGIEFKDGEYKATYEILNSEKSTDSIQLKSFTINGKGKNINDAFDNANTYLSKKPYYSHIKVLVINKDLEKDNLDEVFEYLTRKNEIRNEFNVLVTEDEPSEILSNTSKSVPVVSLMLYDMLNNSKYGSNIAINLPFEKVLSSLISNKSDMIISTIEIKNEKIKLLGATTYYGYEVASTLSKDETALYNLLKNNTNNTPFKKQYNNSLLAIDVYNSNIKLDINNNCIKVSGLIEASLLDNTTELKIEKETDLKKMNNDFKKVISKDIKKLINKFQNNKTDVLKFSEKYYKKYGKENNKIWQYLDVLVDIDVQINKKGLIFEVKDEK